MMSDDTIKSEKEQAMHPTRDEFNNAFERLHDKLDSNKDHFNDRMNELSTEVIEIRTKVDLAPIVTIPGRPCAFFKEHETEHKKLQFIWIKSIIGAVVAAVATALSTAWLYMHKHL